MEMEMLKSDVPKIKTMEDKIKLLECQVAGLITDVVMLKMWKSRMSKQQFSEEDIASCLHSKTVPQMDNEKVKKADRGDIMMVNDHNKEKESPGSSFESSVVHLNGESTKQLENNENDILCVRNKQGNILEETVSSKVFAQVEQSITAIDTGEVMSVDATANDHIREKAFSGSSFGNSAVFLNQENSKQLENNENYILLKNEKGNNSLEKTVSSEMFTQVEQSSTVIDKPGVMLAGEQQIEATSLEINEQSGNPSEIHKENQSWVTLMEEEEKETKCTPSVTQEDVLVNGQLTKPFCMLQVKGAEISSEIEKNNPLCNPENKPAAAVEKTVHCKDKEQTAECNSIMKMDKIMVYTSDIVSFSKVKNQNVVHSPHKQKASESKVNWKNVMPAAYKQKSPISSMQVKQGCTMIDSSPKEDCSYDYSKEMAHNTNRNASKEEQNGFLCYITQQNTLCKKTKPEKKGENISSILVDQTKLEDKIMEDTTIYITEKKCPTCGHTIKVQNKSTDSEIESNLPLKEIQNMSIKQLQRKYIELVKHHQILIDAVCDPYSISCSQGTNCLLNAARDGDVEEAILQVLSEVCLDVCDEDGYTPLHLAVWNDHVQICKLLLGYNVSANVTDSQNNTPLHFAARKGNAETCKLLLDWYASLDTRNSFGTTPLHFAAKEGHCSVCYLLVGKRAMINIADKWGNTPLHMAACNGHAEICELLVKHEADLNVQNNMGNTPLHNACKAGHLEIVQMLVKEGASLIIKCNKGNTPKEMIKTGKCSGILQWFTTWENNR